MNPNFISMINKMKTEKISQILDRRPMDHQDTLASYKEELERLTSVLGGSNTWRSPLTRSFDDGSGYSLSDAGTG